MNDESQEEYELMILIGKRNKTNIPIICSTIPHIDFCISQIKHNKVYTLDELLIIVGDKPSYFCYSYKTHEGILQFNDFELWNKLRLMGRIKPDMTDWDKPVRMRTLP